MRVNGEWLNCEGGVVRPVVPGLAQVIGGQWIEVTFLLDAGADRTVFSADFLALLQPLEILGTSQTRLAGVGGQVNSIFVETTIGFIRDDRQLVRVRGSFGVFTEGESAELSVLGRDVTDNFSVIYDYPNQAVALLSPPHYYEIKNPS
ncbi:MAG: hypothetical protein H0W76_01880 [Pyrinomonadaceae bacterium]|nr:hypothetical protein [Pyrinomonadaceae bacterium]